VYPASCELRRQVVGVQDLGDEVTGQILELALEVYSPTAWHGACLALAELARRGVLLPYRLQPIAPIIARALQLDIRRGAHRY
jgi:hypothetical protein